MASQLACCVCGGPLPSIPLRWGCTDIVLCSMDCADMYDDHVDAAILEHPANGPSPHDWTPEDDGTHGASTWLDSHEGRLW